jgi:hypothetical protein
MGLLTVAPPSTFPELELECPDSGALVLPEIGLGPDEWVVFAGETIGFMTNGRLNAPIHRVPWVDTGGAFRCSMPFFLRASPSAELLQADVADSLNVDQQSLGRGSISGEGNEEEKAETASVVRTKNVFNTLTCRELMESHVCTPSRPWRQHTNEVFLMSQKPLFLRGPKGLLLQAIYSSKTLFLLGTKESSQKKLPLTYKEHLTYEERQRWE